MKITLITLSTPTFNNLRAASALPYHLIDGCKEAEFMIYSYNINQVGKIDQEKTEKNLNTKIRLLACPKWTTWIFKLRLTFLRVLFKYPFLCYYKLSETIIHEILEWKPDRIWIYGEELTGIAKCFKGIDTIVTMPDCESMYYHRLLTKNFATQKLSQIIRYSIAYFQYRRMERDLWRKDVKYHFVGKADANFFRGINPEANAIFLPHPVFAHKEDRKIKFRYPKIKILIAGRYDIYMKEACDDAFQVFLDNKEFINCYEITFLGKGWEMWAERLKQSSYICQHVIYAPDYIKELIQHDIQLSPIIVGTGTKGKVLDALSNGLMVIGTPLALENIQVENGKSCICYNTKEELNHYLKVIPSHIRNYELMAENGRKNILKYHSKEVLASMLFA